MTKSGGAHYAGETLNPGSPLKPANAIGIPLRVISVCAISQIEMQDLVFRVSEVHFA